MAGKVLARELKANGFDVLYYESTTTSSAYLKLDYGANGSIRVSDHAGYKHLSFKYNLVLNGNFPHRKKRKGDTGKYYMYPDDYDRMVREIIDDREGKKAWYGDDRYLYFIRKNREEHEGDLRGFWSKAEAYK